MKNTRKEKILNDVRLIKKSSKRLIKFVNTKYSKNIKQKMQKELNEIESIISKIAKMYKLHVRTTDYEFIV